MGASRRFASLALSPGRYMIISPPPPRGAFLCEPSFSVVPMKSQPAFFGNFKLDPSARELLKDGERVMLPGKSLDCLCYLVENRERAVGRDELIAAVWGRVEVSDTVVSQTLLRLRRALGDTGDRQEMIRTVRGFGYQWVSITAIGVVASEPPLYIPDATSKVSDAPHEHFSLRSVKTVGANVNAPKPRKNLILAMLLGFVFTVAVIFWFRLASNERDGDPVIAVLPMVLKNQDAASDWLSLGAMNLISRDLRESGVNVLSKEEALRIAKENTRTVEYGSVNAYAALQSASSTTVVVPTGAFNRGRWSVRLDTYRGGVQSSVWAEAQSPLQAASLAADIWLEKAGKQPLKRPPSPMEEMVYRVDAELLAGDVAKADQTVKNLPSDWKQDPDFLVRSGQIRFRQGRLDEAEQYFLKVFARGGGSKKPSVGAAWMGLGAIKVRRELYSLGAGDYSQAIQLLSVLKDAESQTLLAHAYNGRGMAQIFDGKLEAGLADLSTSRTAMLKSGNAVDAAMVATNLGQVLSQNGHFVEALNEFEAAEDVFSQFEVNDYLAATLMSRSDAEMHLLRVDDAMKSIEKARRLSSSLADPILVSAIGSTYAQHSFAAGRFNDVAAVLAGMQRRNDPVDVSVVVVKAKLKLIVGNAMEAKNSIEELPEEMKSDYSLALVAIQTGLVLSDDGMVKAWLSRMESNAVSLTNVQELKSARYSIDLAKSLVASGRSDYASAVVHSRLALGIAGDGLSLEDQASASMILGLALLSQGKQRDAEIAVAPFFSYRYGYYPVRITLERVFANQPSREGSHNPDQPQIVW